MILPTLPPRPMDAHKGAMGRVVLVMGSRGMAGAAALAGEAARACASSLAGEAAMRSGAGYAVLCVPGAIGPDLTAAIPSAVQCLCGDSKRNAFLPEDVPLVLKEVARAQCLVLGPGMGREECTGTFLRELLIEVARGFPNIPVVFDADALFHLGETMRDFFPMCGVRALEPGGELPVGAPILTPHLGEAAHLLGGSWSISQIQENRKEAACELARVSGAVVLLKGAGSLVAKPGDRPDDLWKNPSGNPGMATAGSGDVLSGLLGGFLARGMNPIDATRLAAFVHGRAGDLAVVETGEESMLASDLLRFLPAALKEQVEA